MCHRIGGNVVLADAFLDFRRQIRRCAARRNVCNFSAHKQRQVVALMVMVMVMVMVIISSP
ncbi:hypothetical protein IBT47_19680 [Erwinia sp. S43]|uniref:hypothetical protein n=1 Tax=Erwinia sp. S43 TaxID=2769339 RepID=UPI00190B40D1|nr:hypothetical protein [Erwinia sp. S43]MBK0034515.1 hypothetical protein [Erwinia sp. S43]